MGLLCCSISLNTMHMQWEELMMTQCHARNLIPNVDKIHILIEPHDHFEHCECVNCVMINDHQTAI